MSDSRFLRFPEVSTMTGLSRRTLYRAINAGEFPKPRKLRPHGRAVGWESEAVAAWMKARGYGA